MIATWGACSGTCSCPRCGYSYYPTNHTSPIVTYTITGTGSNGFEYFQKSVRELSETIKRNPKWRVWHQPAITECLRAILPLYADAVPRRTARMNSRPSIGQLRRHKRRMWVQAIRCSALNGEAKP